MVSRIALYSQIEYLLCNSIFSYIYSEYIFFWPKVANAYDHKELSKIKKKHYEFLSHGQSQQEDKNYFCSFALKNKKKQIW